MKKIETLAEAKRRIHRGFLIFFVVACTLAFGQPLVILWSDGILRAIAIGTLVSAVVALVLGGVILVTMRGVDCHLTTSWEAKGRKESTNNSPAHISKVQ